MNIKLSILQCMWRNDPHRNHRATRCGNATHLRNVMSPMFNTGSHPTRVYTRAYDMTPLPGLGEYVFGNLLQYSNKTKGP